MEYSVVVYEAEEGGFWVEVPDIARLLLTRANR